MHQARPRPTLHYRYAREPGYGSPLYVSALSGIGNGTSAAAGSATPWGAIITAAFSGIQLAIAAILNSGCGKTCIVTSGWANQAADLLEQNIRAYFALPIPRAPEAQAAALSNFDKVWAYLYQECSNIQLGSAGQACISDRRSGACKWTQTGQPEFPGQPAYGDCWNWFNSFRDPIAHDTNVQTSAVSSETAALLNPAGSASASTLWLMAGAALLLLGVAGSS